MTTTTTRPGTPAPAPTDEPRGSALRAATALAPLVSRRRSRDDAGLLTLTAVLLAVTVLLSVALPRLQARTADATVRGVVAEAGTDADLTVRLPNRDSFGPREPDPDEATLVANLASEVWGETPATIRDVTAAPVTAVETISRTSRVAGAGQVVRLVHVGSNEVGAPLVRWVEGAAPDAAPRPADAPEAVPGAPILAPVAEHEIRVGLAATTAEQLGIAVGTRFPLTLPAEGRVVAHVTGVFEPLDATAAQWQTYDDLLEPLPAATGSQAENRVAYLLSDESLPDAMASLNVSAISRLVRLPAEPEAFSERGAATVARDLSVLLATPGTYATPDGQPGIETNLPDVLEDAVDRLTAARAQASVLLVGLATVGALALVLAARLLVGRREGLLLAERARGASVASVVVRALAESVPVGLVATAAGALLAVLLVPGTEGSWVVAGSVAVVAMVAPAVASALVVRRAWTGARQPANRSDRERIARRRGARRVTAELALAAVAAAAVVSVRGRGLVPPGSGGDVDLLLAAAPALLAAAATVLAARVLPPVLRGLSRAAARRRGLVGVVASARAARATGTLVPILTLTTAVALVVFSGTTAVTVRAGQLAAADVVVGATVRLDGSVSTEQVDLLRTAPGVTAVASASERIGRSFGRSSGVKARVLMVDTADMARVLAARGEPSDGWARLADPSTEGRLPALLTSDLARTAQILEPEFMATDGFVPLDVQGTVEDVPRLSPLDDEELAELQAGGTDPAFVVDRARYQEVVGSAVPLQTVWVQGPGAASAVRDAGLEDKAGVTVTVREEWLESARSSPVGSGLTILLLGSAAVLAMYAAVALALTVVATSRERGRTLSALRTQGLDARTARALTLGELAPLAVVSVVAGTAIGVVVPWALTDALGLDLLTGAPGTAELRLTWVPVAGAAAVIAVSLVAAVLVESAVRRRDRLGEVLRVGER